MTCKNCDTSLSAESDFCHICGAKVIRNRLTIKNLFEHFSETFLNYDNKLLQTFIMLFKKPEDVIGSYINGTRKKYVDVISYFAIAITVSGLYLFILNNFFPKTLDYSMFAAAGQEEFNKKSISFVQEYMSLLMMLYVPLYAVMARMTFIGIKKFNFTELLVVFLYLQAQMSIITAITSVLFSSVGINQGIVSVVSIPLMILYSAFCLKRLYNLNFRNIFLRTLLFLVILGITFFVIEIIMLGIMYSNGSLQELIEAQKAAK
ncbi:DUF3667 domain-containing protein [Flavivirga spongiicola]|uniref:DUF3667 domain-containing protein n=1 Tax=Flavivirga spongiicola TaxID=421621 RepID=A0ABU7XN53_9FLAO|nr:DUF3667 domain-containing protein [Flavivirga sp. MEBiC05379]MDO5981542.1 DUF3667 domain-containing protein [Flavivirga sp. MEBiC05379]